jgi:DNA polymerase-3 subunit delta'
MISFPNWLQPTRDSLTGMIDREQCPHAMLIHGPPGNGRRLLAMSLIGHRLGAPDFDPGPFLDASQILNSDRMPQHPDFYLVQPEPEKRMIKIDAVRALIADLNLTSHQSGAKTALITPAEMMTRNASNALLKTLEEPEGHSLIVLVTDALSRLPATVVSRCHRVRVTAPDTAGGLSWLRGQDPDVDWGPVLELAGGAPMAAMTLQEAGFASRAAEYGQDIQALLDKRTTPAKVAKRWGKHEPDRYLRWLYFRVSAEMRSAHGVTGVDSTQKSGKGSLQMAGKMLNIESSFTCLRDIDELRRLQGAGLNGELQLSDLLTRWYGGAWL